MTRLTLAVIVLSSSVWAQQPKQEVRFSEPEQIDGQRKAPDVSHISVHKGPTFSNLIKVRENFADKIMKSVDQM